MQKILECGGKGGGEYEGETFIKRGKKKKKRRAIRRKETERK